MNGRLLGIGVVLGCALVVGCQKSATTAASRTSDQPSDAAAAMPDVGAATPVTHTSLDDAAGGGVNSAAMRKAKGVAAEGVSSVNSAQKQGYGAGDDTGN